MIRKSRSARARKSPSPRPKAEPQPSIHVAHTRLEDRLRQLEDAFNTNTKVFSDGIQMLEAQNEVLRRALRDVMNRKAVLLPGHAKEPTISGAVRELLVLEPSIDWNAYLKEYIEELEAKEARAEEKAGPGPILLDSDPEQPTIFGGGP